MGVWILYGILLTLNVLNAVVSMTAAERYWVVEETIELNQFI